jgi:hypothetical protein
MEVRQRDLRPHNGLRYVIWKACKTYPDATPRQIATLIGCRVNDVHCVKRGYSLPLRTRRYEWKTQ